MTLRRWCGLSLCVAASLAAGSFAWAGNFDASIDALEKAVQKETAEKKKSTPQQDQERAYRSEMGLSAIAQIRTVLDRDDGRDVEEMLNRLSAYYQSEAVQQATAQLRKEVSKARESRQKALSDEMKEAVAAARKAVKTAKKANDLDAVLEKLSDANIRSEYRSAEGLRAESRNLQQARQFVINWQNYLMAVETGDTQNARSNLQNLSNMDEGLLPRSVILERLAEFPDENRRQNEPVDPPKLSEIVGERITLEKVPRAIAALNQFLDQPRKNYRSLGQLQNLREELTQLQMTRTRFEAGLPSTFKMSFNAGGENQAVQEMILPARIELMRLVLPVYFGVPDKPGKNETMQAYLDRVMAAAAQKLDVPTMQKVFDVQAALEWNSPAPARSGSVLQMLLIARNQEEAGQYTLAVMSYQSALKNAGDLVPAKTIGERLKAIQDAHPQEYKAAMEQAMEGREARGSSGSRSSNGNVVIPGRDDTVPTE